MDVRELALWQRGASIILVEKQLQELYHLRVAGAETKDYNTEIDRLNDERNKLLFEGGKKIPKTEGEYRAARREFAKLLRLDVKQ